MSCLLLRNVRPLGAAAVDVRVEDGVIAEIGTDVAAGPEVAIEDGNGQLLVPGFVDAHMHLARCRSKNAVLASLVRFD